jgi:23S rRNA (cytidine2498-2'-O)-methyltransferase
LAAPRLTWAFLTRAGGERDLIDEIGESHLPEAIAEGVVVSASRPRSSDGSLTEITFARQALHLEGPPSEIDLEILAERIARAMASQLGGRGGIPSWTLQIVAPDSRDPKDPRRRARDRLERDLPEALLARLADRVGASRVSSEDASYFVQAWIIDEDRALIGVTSAQESLSRTLGGKIHLRRAEDAPSRSGLKLEEAIEWIGVGPEKGDLCADLGASPGGWSQVAVGRGATVIAVDPAPVKIHLPPKRFTYKRLSAFEFAPLETLDWLLCDMAWRPLEVAQLVAKWGRRAWARQAIVNFKLPMKRKAEMLAQIRDIMAAAGWRGIRSRQLYHDRDEVTVFAWLDPNLTRKGARAPFALRSRKNDGKRKRPDQRGRGRSKNPPRRHAR